jgi:DNA-binding SARP family transcriptional activator
VRAIVVTLRTLGSIDVRDAAGRTARSVLAQTKRLAVLVRLAASPDQRCRRDTLLGLFWPDQDSVRARGALRQALRFLRRELGKETLVSVGDDELLLPSHAMTCDVAAFARALAERHFEDALQLYNGDFVPGMFVPSAAPEFDDWLDAERSRMRSAAIDSVVRLIARAREARNAELALQWARRAVVLAPDDECLRQTLLHLLDEVGDRSGALRAYEDFAKHLRRELGVEPSIATQALTASIRGASGKPAEGVARRA